MPATQFLRTQRTLDELSEMGPIEIAIDTEFKDVHTLTIQAATRLSPEQVAVQVFRSSAIPGIPADFRNNEYLSTDEDEYGRFFRTVVRRRTRIITPKLSPVRILGGLFGLDGVEPISRHQGQGRAAEAPNAGLRPGSARWAAPSIKVVIVGHFLRADFARMFGSAFYADLFSSQTGGEPALAFTRPKFLGLAYAGSEFAGPPIVEYAADPIGNLFQIHLETRDIGIDNVETSLEGLSRTFLGVGKGGSITKGDKADMVRTFREKPRDAYGYAIVDVVNTLLVHEQMTAMHEQIYESFGNTTDIPPMKPTIGSRSSQFLARMTTLSAAGSSLLAKERDVKALMKKGGLPTFGGERAASRFGMQTGQVHGGLIYTRTPTRLWDQAPGMMGDVDMASCYARIIAGMNVYWGRPVVREPGNKPMSLREAVEYLSTYCDRDAWYIRVTGKLTAGLNALIPSTIDAISAENYRKRKPKSVERPRAKLFSGEIVSGVITAATWSMLQTLPPAIREEYEALSAESLVFYPRFMVAEDGVAFDQLSRSVGLHRFPWAETMDLRNRVKIIEEPIDADFASLKFAMGELTQEIMDRREEAQQRDGKKSASEQGWKLMANSLFGVLGSGLFATGNAVAANIITATARAGAFALVQSLNGYQVITDGCTYRRDQIPSCTYAECLQLHPDYPIRRAEAGGPIPFLDPAEIPIEDAEFTAWYREHARRFFGVEGDPSSHPFMIHDLEHKETAGRKTFDGLACMGAADYAKCNLQPDGTWKVEKLKVRGYSTGSKKKLSRWILATLPTDHLETLPPVTTETRLLKLGDAIRRARRFLGEGVKSVALPLGHQDTRVRTYKVIRLSAFIANDARQWKLLNRQFDKFLERCGSGLEILAFKRGYRNQPTGSLSTVAERIFAYIRANRRDFNQKFHLNRLPEKLEAEASGRIDEVSRLKEAATDDLLARIETVQVGSERLVAAILCTDAKSAPLDSPH